MPDSPKKYVSKAMDLRPSPDTGATMYTYAKNFPLESLKRPVTGRELIAEWEVLAAVGFILAAYAFLSQAKTNIGTAFIDIYSAAFQPDDHLINFTGYTQFRILFMWDYVGAGTQQVRWVDKANNANVLWTSGNITADQDPGDSGWQSIPAAFQNTEKTIEWQGKSTTGTDDPVAKGFVIYLK